MPIQSSICALLGVPLFAFLVAFGLIEAFALDPVIAHAWYFDESALRWLGAGSGAWWARDLLHSGGRWVVRGIAAAALAAWLLSFVLKPARPWRQQTGFIALAMIASTAIVGLLKTLTNVDCPWDLEGFGGAIPYVPLFADRPDWLPRAQCFPGAHASSGFALFSFYFALRDSQPRRAYWALGLAIAVGVAFSIGQEARGAHFLSHDLVSAALVWLIQLALYVWLLRDATSPAAARAGAPLGTGSASSPGASPIES